MHLNIKQVLVQVIAIAVLSICVNGGAHAQANAEPERVITNITGDLYSFRQNRHIGMFLVTDEGIIVVDPTFPEVAAWLKDELDERFGLPVRYVIYSHSHNDHAGGGAVFEETATYVGHENMRANLIRPADDAPLLPREKLWDDNGDGRIQENEAGGYIGVDTAPNGFAKYDADKNGWMSRAELWAARFGGPTVRTPDLYYSDKMVLTLGGKSVELHYTGLNHTNDMTTVLFPAEKTIYTVDFLTPNRLPRTSLDGGFLPEWVESLRLVAELDFDIIVPGHESPGTKAQVVEQVQYLDDLHTQVSAAIANGDTLEQMIDSILLEEYSELIEYEYSRRENVIAAYEMIISSQ